MGDYNVAGKAVLVEAKGDDLLCIENLMQFYQYALSQSYPLSFADNGLYTVRSKQSYWSKPSVRPYLIRVGTALAGFAVVDDRGLNSKFRMQQLLGDCMRFHKYKKALSPQVRLCSRCKQSTINCLTATPCSH